MTARLPTNKRIIAGVVGMAIVIAVAVTAVLLAQGDGDDRNEAIAQPTTPPSTLTPTATATATATPPSSPTPAPTATATPPDVSTPAPADGAERYTAAAVWDVLDPMRGDPMTPELIGKLHECRAANTDCVVQVMRGAGASNEAITFFEETGWFLVRFREKGIVDLGNTVDPWRANDNGQYYLMNGHPALVSPEDEGTKLSFTSDPNYQRLTDAVASAGIEQSPVNLFIWGSDDVFESMIATGQGGTRFVFQYRIVNSCHAAYFGYRERVGLDFDDSGQYIGAELISLCRGDDAKVDLSGIPACPATSR